MSTISPDGIEDISSKIIAGMPFDAGQISLDDFSKVYHCITQRTGTPSRIDVVLLGDRCYVQFSSLPPGDRIIYVTAEKRLVPDDFSRIIANPYFHGDVLPTRFRQQIREDWKNLLVSACLALVVVLLSFLIAVPAASNYSAYLSTPTSYPQVDRVLNSLSRISELMLTSSTLFISLFLVFTVAQSTKLQQDVRLFDSGLLHKFARDDRLIAIIALTGFFLGILNSALIGLPYSWDIASFPVITGQILTINKLTLFVPLINGLALLCLAYCFLALLYYVKRTMLLTDRDISAKVLAACRNIASADKADK